MSILRITNLQIDVRTQGGPRAVVDGIDLTLERGRIHGLAGESGSGKTVTALAILGLLPESMTTSGSVVLDTNDVDTELLGAPRQVLAGIRGRRIAMVFQDPSTSLHPQLSVGRQLTDHMRHHLKLGKRDARDRARALLERVRVPDPTSALKKFPHQFSGGQRQRIAIAVALACEPDVLLADEPTTALDVTVQAGILQLLRELVDDAGLSVLLVTHDLGVMSAVADEVAVMRAGVIVESAPRQQLFTDPQHAYTRSLLAALPGSKLEESPEALVAELLNATRTEAIE
ncbi:ABC transporter ATP-binding protein [Lacisediminihabitans profunda]|uniref:ABC transporter ATP-binding protein n=1 Tax=Lacisediminihabitans profunda TaxID=2594790 RepID=A0A5C8UVF6_9MICO|nr:ABC transporter ATP-binding protein [Lacisediminihabitans profunda]